MAEIFSVEESQLRRLMTLCRHLKSSAGMSIGQLMSKGKASRRTIYRDFLTLDTFGIKVELGQKGYFVSQSSAKCKQLIVDSLRRSLERIIARSM